MPSNRIRATLARVALGRRADSLLYRSKREGGDRRTTDLD